MKEFELEQYFAKYEFSAKYLLGSSDAQTISMKQLLEWGMEDEECAELWNNLELGYTESTGLPMLKKEIASMYGGLAEENILCFAGAEEAIYATMRALLKEGDHVCCILPAYQSLISVAEDVVGSENVTGIDLVDRDGKWILPMKSLRRQVQKNTKLIIMNFPHNPTGALITHEEQKEIVELARENGTYIFFDEVYRGLEMQPELQLPQMCTLYEKALSLGVMSKAFGLPGLRIGWLASQDQNSLRLIGDYKHFLSICNSGPSEVLALMALRCREKILARIHSIIQRNLLIIDDFLLEFSDLFVWNAPVAGCIGLMHMKGNVDIDQFAQAMMEGGSVMILPGYLFPSTNPSVSTRNTFRFGFGRSNFKEAMEVFRAAIRRYRGSCSVI